MAEQSLTVRDVVVRYGRAVAVSGASLAASPGTITAIVGPNGAGKSSFLMGVQGVVAADVARLTLAGESLLGMSPSARAKAGMELVPQGRQIFPTLPVRTNLQVMADARGLGGDSVEQALDRFPILRERRRHPAGVLSGGEQQMLALARALMSNPRVLLLDEPTEGLAPVIVNAMRKVLDGIRDDGGTIVICEPTTRLLPERIDLGLVMMRGEIVARAESRDDLHEQFAKQFEGLPDAVGSG